jgi:hypothetical protein
MRRAFALLAPHPVHNTSFRRVEVDSEKHSRLLLEVQRFRGEIALEEGAVRASELLTDGRHVQAADYKSWHMVTMDEHGRVAACMRYLPHRIGANFSDLLISSSSLARCRKGGGALREAIESELASARERGLSYVEMGGWVIAKQFRNTTEAIRMVLSAYGLGQLLGGALGVSTATTHRSSSSIIKRLGGERLATEGEELPTYYDAQYRCQMEILRFDSARPGPRYQELVERCAANLRNVPIVCQEPLRTVPEKAADEQAGKGRRSPKSGRGAARPENRE